jgi:hypothetical protein
MNAKNISDIMEAIIASAFIHEYDFNNVYKLLFNLNFGI